MLPSASLPNLSEPGILGTGAILGGLAGRTLARLLGYDADKCMRWAVDGGYVGSGIALGVYLIVNFLEVGV